MKKISLFWNVKQIADNKWKALNTKQKKTRCNFSGIKSHIINYLPLFRLES